MTDIQQQPANGQDVANPGPWQSDAVAQAQSLLATVPDAEDQGGGQDGILAQLAGAQSPEDLDKPWQARDFESLLGATVVVYGIAKRPADYQGGLSHYLVVDLADQSTGERMTVTTGSVNIVGQLVVAYAKGWLPIQARVEQSQKATRNGFFPLRLTNISRYQVPATNGQPAV